MHDWNFTPDHPISLPISADARLSPTDYINDQIWELCLGNTEPPAISLQTTFGLRARFCRIFPRFIYDNQVVNNPADFHQQITIHQYYPNYIRLSFRPFSCINVVLEYWVPDSHSIACQSRIVNISHETCQIQIEWAELLVPAPDGNRMSIKEIGLTTILAGETANLTPVLFVAGGAQAGKSPYPALNLSYSLPPNADQETRLAHSTMTEMNTSFEVAKDVLSKNWDTEFARIIRKNSQQLEITTGNPDWNMALYLTQTLADQLILQPTPLCNSSSFVHSRNPDQGFSLLKDGSDYNHSWNGQTPLDAYYLTNFLIPTAPGLARGLLENFLATQSPQGEIDLKPGLGGQRSQLLATPLLSHMAWQLYQYTGDIEYLRTVFPKLLSFFYSWFTDKHDRDSDFIPEWDQTIQTGFEEHPLFSYLNIYSGGTDISTVESPDLCSFLYRECQSLISIAKKIANIEAITPLEIIADKLKTTVEQSWSDNHACFLYRDRDSHISSPMESLGKLKGAGVIEIHQEFQPPVRPIIHIKFNKEGTRPAQIYIHGTSTADSHRVDHIGANQIHWYPNAGYFTSEFIYKTIEQIEVTGIFPDDEVFAQTSCLTSIDQTLLLPLWAGIPSEDKAKILINLSIMNKKRFLSPHGLRACVEFPNQSGAPEEYSFINILFTSLVTEGLIRYGERKKAAEVFTRLMKTVVHSLRKDLTFHQFYHSETGKPLGAVNSLTSLVPIGLFLNILGVKIINASKVEITGDNPFPWPVTIKYRGLTVVQQEKKSVIIFSDGQNITVDNNKPQVISYETPR